MSHVPVTPEPDSGGDLAALRDGYVEALLAPDARRARALIADAAERGVSIPRLYCDVLAPALQEVGSRWERADISVAQEHLATQLTQAVLAQLALRLGGTGTGVGRTAIVCCSPGELHSIGGQMVADFLEADGWTVLSLGADVPPEDVAELVTGHRAELVALSTALPAHLMSATLTCTALRRLDDPPLIIAGGRAYAGDEQRALVVGADAFATDPETLLAILADRLDGDARPPG